MVAVLACSHTRGGLDACAMASPTTRVDSSRDVRIDSRFAWVYRQSTLRPARLMTTSAAVDFFRPVRHCSCRPTPAHARARVSDRGSKPRHRDLADGKPGQEQSRPFRCLQELQFSYVDEPFPMFTTRHHALVIPAKDAIAIAGDAVVCKVQQPIRQNPEDSGPAPWTAKSFENKQAGAGPFDQTCLVPSS